MNNTSTAQADLNQQTNGFAVLIDWPVEFLCTLAGFPYDRFKLIRKGGDRAKVMGRGASVIISLTACLMAVGQNAEALFGHAWVVFLLPLVVIIFDRLIVSNSYGDDIDPQIQRCRYALVLISVYITLGSALISEKDNLLKNLFADQTQQAVRSDSTLHDMVERINMDRQAIKDNEKALQERSTIENTRIEELRLAEYQLLRGGCITKCKTHKANAAAAQARLDGLDALAARNVKLQREIAEREAKFEELLKNHLGDSNSVGTLFKSFFLYPDFGVWFRVLPNTLVLMIFELSALAMAHTKASQNMRAVIDNITSDDALRQRGAHKTSTAEILAEQAKTRALFGANLTPVIVRIPTAPQPTHTQTPLHSVKNESEGESKHG
jgi:hypothetical protein